MKSQSSVKVLIPMLALALAGCGGSSDSHVVTGGSAGGGGTGTGGGGSTPPPSSTQRFSYPSFPNSGQATLVTSFQPTTENSSLTSEILATVNQGMGTLAQSALPRHSSVAAKGALEGRIPCGTADVKALTAMLGEDTGVREQSAPAVRPRFQELQEGARESFILIAGAFRTVTAEKMLAPQDTVHCTIFAELDESGRPCVTREKALAVAQAFDSNNPSRPGSGIYSQVRSVFGSEWNQNPAGGRDGDSKVVIVFFRSETLGRNLYGYTSPVDSSATSELSNKGEFVYINADKDLTQTLSTLAHEFQHLINYNEKVIQQGTFPAGAQDENVSINEGLSQLAEEVCGFDFDQGNTLLVSVTNDYLSRPEEHEFFDFFAAGVGYGQSYLFFKYVREHFGDATIRAIVDTPAVGKANLDRHLAPGFAEVFRRWTIANYATNLSGNVPAIYRYPSGFRTNGNYNAGQLVGPYMYGLSNNTTNKIPELGAWSVSYSAYAGGNGGDLNLAIQSNPISSAGVVYEALRGTFSRLD